ncbi:MAG: glycosyltransferase family 2 protein [bacterium]|nr:glycosyltransferase family 2 protein [bacterium]
MPDFSFLSDFSFPLVYQLLITAVLCALTATGAWNIWRMKRLGGSSPLPIGSSSPFPIDGRHISVLVPARNEERCIEACVRSLCLQTYLNAEVIVLDDGSTDATPSILRGLQLEFPTLKVICGTPLPTGWVGKSWACHQLSLVATGDVLLFTDADTVHEKECLAATAEFVRDEDVEFFSVVPFEIMGSFAEHVVIPMIHVLFMCSVPTGLGKNKGRNPAAAANGQFMCFTRAGYEKAGGHVGVHDSMVEDLFLAKNAKRAGLRMIMIDATHLVSCRMYENARDVIDGFSKNFFPATNYNLLSTAFFMMHVVTAYIVPVFFWLEGWYALTVIQLSAAACIRLMIALKFRMPLWHVFLQPITATYAVFIGMNSIRWSYSKQGLRWKGRSYSKGE